MNTPVSTIKRICISDEIFNTFPDYCRGIVIVGGIKNIPSPDELVGSLVSEEDHLRSVLAGKDLNTIPRLESWREAFRSLGIKPTKIRPSIDALVRRVVSGASLPTINLLVDIGNLMSLRHMIPIGVHAIDVLHEGMELAKASGNEIFKPFGADVMENPDPGEYIFRDGNLVMTRRWVWRQAQHTLVHEKTTAVEYNIDGLPPVTSKEVGEICLEVEDEVRKFLDARIVSGMLTRSNPVIDLPQP